MTLLLGWPNRRDHSTPVGFGRQPQTEVSTRPIRDPNREGHWLCVAPTGSGKSASFAVPQLLSWPGSIVVIDIKGELAHVTARHRRSLGEVLILDPFGEFAGEGGSFNPLSHIDPDGDGLIDDAYTLANLFCTSAGRESARMNEAFWEDWGQDVIAGMIVHALRHEDPARRTLGEVYSLLHTHDPIYDLACLLDKQDPHPFTESKIGAYITLPETTRGGVTATVHQQMRMLAGPSVQKTFSHDSIDMQAFSDGAPCTIYLVLPPDRLNSHAALTHIVLTSLVQRLLRRRRRPEHPTLLLVDEAAQLGPVPALNSAITLGRGFGIRAALLVQSLAQLRTAYGTSYEALLENSSLMTMGRYRAFSMAVQLAEQGFGDVSARELYEMSADELMIHVGGGKSRRLHKLDYRQDAMFAGRFDPNPFYERGPIVPERTTT